MSTTGEAKIGSDEYNMTSSDLLTRTLRQLSNIVLIESVFVDDSLF